jgi:beta-galactosidase
MAHEVHDFAWVFLDGKQIGVMDRRHQTYSVPLPERTTPGQLDILVEAMGHVNFGWGIYDRKGLYAPAKLADSGPLTGWEVYSFPLDDAELSSLHYQTAPANGPAFWRGGFDLTQTGDTFLDLRGWGKGVVWVNGHCLGRYWDIGPTQTMYMPGPWLKTGHNEVVVLDLIGPREPKLAGLAQPILDELHPELELGRKTHVDGTISVDSLTPAGEGSFGADTQAQEVHFTSPVTGRYLCLQGLNAIDGKPIASVAELEAFDAPGQVLPRTNWKLIWVDGAEPGHEGGNALDGQSSSTWDTPHSGTPYPHAIVIDLGQSTTVGGISYLPSSDTQFPGHIKDYKVYVSDQPFGLTPSQ